MLIQEDLKQAESQVVPEDREKWTDPGCSWHVLVPRCEAKRKNGSKAFGLRGERGAGPLPWMGKAKVKGGEAGEWAWR